MNSPAESEPIERSRTSVGSEKNKKWISKAVDIRVSPDALYQAISTADGLRGWWCNNIMEDGSEGVLQLSFKGGAHSARIRFDKGKAPSRAEWDVLEHRPLSEWNGTKLVFDIEKEDPKDSKLRFQHVGLNPDCECYGACNNAWSYLMESIKDYLENGKGGPK
jgi:hypothetical protein